MVRRCLALLLAAVLVAGFVPPVRAATGAIRLFIDGTELALDVPPRVVGGRTLVPVRAVAEALGAPVRWNPDTRTVAISGAYPVVLELGSAQALVGGRRVALDVPAQAVGGRTLVPLRFVAEAMGFSVVWDEAQRAVRLTSRPVPAPVQVVEAVRRGELTEGTAGRWQVRTPDGAPAALADDPARARVGRTALRVATDAAFAVELSYPADRSARWNLSSLDYISLWVYAETASASFAEGSPVVRLGAACAGAAPPACAPGYFEYTAQGDPLNGARGAWQFLRIPLAGDAAWQRTQQGSPSLAQIDWIEIRAGGFARGFTLWVDGLEFRRDEWRIVPAFDPVAGGQYPLYVQQTLPDGQELRAAGVQWEAAAGADAVDAAGVLRPSRPGPLTVRARVGRRTVAAKYTAVAGKPEQPYTRTVAHLDVLVAVYTAGMPPEQIAAAARAHLNEARVFFWRNSLGRLALTLDVVEIPGRPPDLTKPTMAPLEADLVRRGVKVGEYSALFVTEGQPDDGRGLNGCWGGFTLASRTAGAYCPLYPAPAGGLPSLTWMFAHEFQHALDLSIATGSGFPGMLNGHPYEGLDYGRVRKQYPAGVDYGGMYNWIAGTLRLFDHYEDLKAPWNKPVITQDSDGDGLPDYDPRLPMDEARLGTDPDRPDTDRDGLNDLAEYTAGTFGGTDPLRADTDRDGLADGADPLPLFPAKPELPAATQDIALDGVLQEGAWRLLASGYQTTGLGQPPTDGARLYATWDRDALYLAVQSAVRPGFVNIGIDGSGRNGPWLGRDYFALRVDTGTGQVLSKQHSAQAAAGLEPEGWGPDRAPARPVPGAQAGAAEPDGLWTMEIRIPRSIGYGFGVELAAEGLAPLPGLTLAPGTVIGLNVALDGLDGWAHVDYPYIGPWGALTEHMGFLDLTLAR